MNDVLVHETTARKVTFFEDRAEIVRTATVALVPGASWIAFGGVTPFIDERSLQVCLAEGAEGTCRVLAARIKRRVHHEQTLGREELDALEAELRKAEHRLAEAIQSGERARARGDCARELLQRWAGGLSTVPRGLHRANGDGRRQTWRAAYDAIVRSETEVLGSVHAARVARARAEHDVAHAEARLRDGMTRHLRHEALVQVRISADAAADALFEITYRTPGALWRPEHVARVACPPDGPEGHGVLDLLTWATVWQRTGEDWDDIDVYLSTARPAHHATPPLLDDDRIVTRRKSDEQRRQTVVEGREQEILSSAIAGARTSIDQMPGVDDGGLPLLYRARAKAHLHSDGRPARLEMARIELPAQVDLVVYPELSGVAHLRATASLTEGGPLLAGPVHVHFAGTAAGRARTRFVGKGDSFELGLGTDDSIRVHREVEREDDAGTRLNPGVAIASLLGIQRRKRTIVIWLSNLSRETKRVRVLERVPVSEIEGLDIDVSARDWTFDPLDGFATHDVELAGEAVRKLVLVYELRAVSKIVLPEI